MSLAGVLEIADREFQTIQDEDSALREAAREAVQTGDLEEVEISPDALKAYLDKRIGPDGRMSAFSYDFTARLLRRLGFKNFRQIDEAIAPYDDDHISRLLWGGRMGQLSRFEDMLLAALGPHFVERHVWGQLPWFPNLALRRLEKLNERGVPTGTYQLPGQDI